MGIKANDARSQKELKARHVQASLQPMPDPLDGEYHPLQGTADATAAPLISAAGKPAYVSIKDDLAKTLSDASWGDANHGLGSTLLETVESDTSR